MRGCRYLLLSLSSFIFLVLIMSKKTLKTEFHLPLLFHNMQKREIGFFCWKQLVVLSVVLLLAAETHASSYTIEFESSSTGSGYAIKDRVFTCAEIVCSGSEYLSGNIVEATNAYEASSGHLKLGLSDAPGSLTMNLSEKGQVQATSIVIKAMRYSTGKETSVTVSYKDDNKEFISLGSQQINTSNGSYGDYTYTLSGSPTIKSLRLQSSKYCYIQSITVNYICQPNKVSVSEVGYSTMYLAHEVTLPENVEAYYVKMNGNVAELYLMSGAVPAETGVIIKANKGEYILTESSTSAERPLGNQLVGYTEDTAIEGSNEVAYYALNYEEKTDGSKEVGFFVPQNASTNSPHSSFTAKANKAYLRIDTPNGKQAIRIRFCDETQVKEMGSKEKKEIYNLTGRRVEETIKGIYIINGKKVLVN